MKAIRTLTVLLVLSVLTGCAASRPPALPPEYASTLPWGAVDPQTGTPVGIERDIGRAGAGKLPADTDGNGRPNYSILFISGGGAKGAFGAGVLKGWSTHGSRPEFTVVTGVSTGALMATWAFLGSQHDDLLEHFYTHTTDAQIFRKKGLFPQPLSDSVLNTTPLRETLASVIDERVLAEVARAHQQGRRLYVASTDLDHNRLVAWDMGAIASSNRPDKLERYREVLRASASIPVAFPPVYFPVTINEQHYGQMHVDGGAVANFFVAGFVFDQQRALAQPGTERSDVDIDFYVLMNGHLEPQPKDEAVSPRLFAIATASFWSTSWAAQTNQLVRLYRLARGMEMGFHIVGISADYDGPLPLASFKPEEMAPLFRYGESLGRTGNFWLSEPPRVDWRERID